MPDHGEIRFLQMEPVNFQDFPVGGTLSFAKQLIFQFKGSVALVGMVTDDSDPVGQWFEKSINGIVYNYFGIGRYRKTGKKPLIPIRLKTFIQLFFNLKKILAINSGNVFTQSPQFLFALNLFKVNSLCFCFAGTANSVALSRYKALRVFGIFYEKALFKILKRKATVILAAADRENIKDAVARTGNILDPSDIITFPTRFDPDVFMPLDKALCRTRLNIDQNTILLVTTGRLSFIKGWQLLIDSALELFRDDNYKNVTLVFAGEGEDREKIENYARLSPGKNIVKLAGKLRPDEVSSYLNAADVFVMGSFHEGWPTSLVEALACGCPIVTTNVSASSEIVSQGENGYIVYDRDPVNFASKIKEAMSLTGVLDFSLKNRNKYSALSLKEDLEEIWLSKI